MTVDFAKVRGVALDVDGVLTDGRLHYGPDGEAFKSFHARDGMGIRLLLDEGVEVAIITARQSPAVARRAADLRIEHAFLGADDKVAALSELVERTGIAAEHWLFVGDDVLDLPAMRAVGFGATVADGHFLVQAEADWIAASEGGAGAVRELADAILEARGGVAAAVDRLLTTRLRRAENRGA